MSLDWSSDLIALRISPSVKDTRYWHELSAQIIHNPVCLVESDCITAIIWLYLLIIIYIFLIIILYRLRKLCHGTHLSSGVDLKSSSAYVSPKQCLEHCMNNPRRRGLMPSDHSHERHYPRILNVELPPLPSAIPSNTIINELNHPIAEETSHPNLNYPQHAMIIWLV